MGALNVYITSSSGKGRKSIRVRGETSGFLGGMTKDVRTDEQGHAMLQWTSNTGYLSKIYVNGKGNSGKFYSGKSYAFQV